MRIRRICRLWNGYSEVRNLGLCSFYLDLAGPCHCLWNNLSVAPGGMASQGEVNLFADAEFARHRTRRDRQITA